MFNQIYQILPGSRTRPSSWRGFARTWRCWRLYHPTPPICSKNQNNKCLSAFLICPFISEIQNIKIWDEDRSNPITLKHSHVFTIYSTRPNVSNNVETLSQLRYIDIVTKLASSKRNSGWRHLILANVQIVFKLKFLHSLKDEDWARAGIVAPPTPKQDVIATLTFLALA